MAFLEINDFNFSYEDTTVLKNLNLKIEEGEFVLMCGPSGSGKTTLLHNIKKELKPKGKTTGEIIFNDKKLDQLTEKESACDIGLMFQNPDSQIVTDTVIQELAFPLENIGLPTEEIRNRISEMAAFFGIDKLLHNDVNELSGGQKQLVNLCSLLVLEPKLLLLDEPTSQLDPIASYDFLTMLRRLNEEFSITIIVTEHKLDNIFPFADKVVYLQDGNLKYNNNSRDICTDIKEDEIFKYYMPEVTKIGLLLKENFENLKNRPNVLSVREGMKELNFIKDSLNETQLKPVDNTLKKSDNTILKVKNLWFGYTKEAVVLKDINLDVSKGEYITIIGGNGTGKSTLLELIAGILDPIKGSVKYDKNLRISFVHQNPMIQFTEDTVKKELSGVIESKLETENLKKIKLLNKKENTENKSDKTTKPVEISDYVKQLVNFFEIDDLLENHPYDCSGGEQQKIAFIKAILDKPDVLILDEPNKGLDPISNLKLSQVLNKLNNEGITIIMTTHDLTFVAENAKRCIMVFDGSLQLDNTPNKIFSNNNFYTTFVNRMVKNYIPNAITLKDVEKQWIQ